MNNNDLTNAYDYVNLLNYALQDAQRLMRLIKQLEHLRCQSANDENCVFYDKDFAVFSYLIDEIQQARGVISQADVRIRERLTKEGIPYVV